jgi:hypothetical protein
MLVTVEIRWFHVGMIPAQTMDWFQHGSQHVDVQPTREDQYLALPACDALGIKLRQGRIEIKQGYQRFDALRVRRRIAGTPRLWRKWGFVLDQADVALAGIPLQSPWWIPVRKERVVRIYRTTGDGTVFAVPAGEYPVRGCQLELTQVRVKGNQWWTLGFEAFGAESTLHEDLLLVANETLAAGEPPRLSSRDCYGYPRWLQIINRGSED